MCSPSKLKYLSEPFTVITEVPTNESLNVVCELIFSQTGSTKSTINASSFSPSGSSTPIVNVCPVNSFPLESYAIGVPAGLVNTTSTNPL